MAWRLTVDLCWAKISGALTREPTDLALGAVIDGPTPTGS